ncbi:MAG: DegT/DnrJ/EryC1/StrS family aminotransferase [Proteobacteria bacterium]|nr:DegT/DnrJ/EryC1/StrS family aminotransferase [Pseudomonadota bacterium]
MSETASGKVAETLNSGFIGQGPKVDEFELLLSKRLQKDHVLTVNSATSAEHLAFHLLKKPNPTLGWPGLEDGDEVLTTALTCTATNWPILANNLAIKWVDVDPETLNLDLTDLRRKITSKTKVIMVVHWGGYPVDLDELKKIQKETKVLYGFEPAIIEDCAHAFGSKYKKTPIGSHGNFCTFSFQAIKHLTTVDGGLLVCPNQDFYDRGKLIRWYGIDRTSNRKDFRCEADIKEWGFKFHMNDVCATIGIENLKQVDGIIKTHQNNASFYDHELSNVNGVKLLKRQEGFESSFWIYSMLVEKKSDFMRYMSDKGITVSQVHARNDTHTCVAEYKKFLPTLDNVEQRLISIPVGWWISEEQREYIADCIKRGW